MTDWQPIETAPKDGTEVLGWSPDPRDGIAIVKYETGLTMGKWSVVHDAESWAWNNYDPTHWMPLPEPPK